MRRLAMLFLAAGLGLGQDNLEIRVTVPLVNVAFVVRDASGNLVTDLSQDDVEVLDDGAVQHISFFAHSADLPLRLGLIADMSGSQESFLKRHELDLKRFLAEVLTERDRAFLVCFGNHLRLASDFSSSGDQIIGGLQRFDKKMDEMPELGPREPRELGTAFYDALFYSVSEKLASQESGRKALIVFSDGEDNSSAHHLLDAIESAQSEDVVFFGVRYTEHDRKGRLTARNKYGASVMARIGRETGGFDSDAEKADLAKSFAEIGRELRSSYELAYRAPNAGDGTFHKVVIRSRRPGLTVRSKTGYFARDNSAR